MQAFFARWFWRATHSRLKLMTAVAEQIRRHLSNVLTYLRHRLTNAGQEAVSATIQWVKKTAREFMNVDHFKTTVYFHYGGLDIYPRESPIERKNFTGPASECQFKQTCWVASRSVRYSLGPKKREQLS